MLKNQLISVTTGAQLDRRIRRSIYTEPLVGKITYPVASPATLQVKLKCGTFQADSGRSGKERASESFAGLAKSHRWHDLLSIDAIRTSWNKEARVPDRGERIKSLLRAAMELPSHERQAFLVQMCGDDSGMLRELEGLISELEQETPTGHDNARLPEGLTETSLTVFESGETVLERFKIVRRIGRGGMGDVYEALDCELSQIVALKTIRPDILGNDSILPRFKKEVMLARQFSGPHVCRIHELFVLPASAWAPQGAFLTMEFLSGVTLAEKLQESGPLPWRQAQAIGLEMCAALTSVHEAGIVHRDLKSRNIMLVKRGTIECAVLMDFGLAREFSKNVETAETGLTATGVILGTPEYMAPEQFERKDLSPATDVYALGIVLYELVTGKQPFAASSALGAAILRGKRPPPASSFQKGLPRRWDRVIGRCLEYDAARRFQTAAEVGTALRGSPFPSAALSKGWSKTIAAGAGTLLLAMALLFVPSVHERLEGMLFSSHEKHVAVLPFDVNGKDAELVALGDGLMDSLSGKLTNLDSVNRSLWVAPASEVRRRNVDNPTAALKEFGATIVVKGSFVRDGKTVRLNLALIDTRKMREIGSRDIVNRDGDLAALQEDALQSLGRLMNLKVGEDADRAAEAGVSAAAYEDYIEALGYLQRYDKPGNLDAGIASLKKAVEAAPDFALALGRLGQASMLKFHIIENPELLEQAKEYCLRAMALDKRIPSVYAALADIHESTGQADLAVQELQHVLDFDPENVEALRGMAIAYLHGGNLKEAESSYIRAAELRPQDWNGYVYLGNFYDSVGRHQDAIAQLEHALQLTPDNGNVYCNLGIAYLNSGDPKLLPKAEEDLKKSIALSPSFQAYASLANLYGVERRFADSAAATEKALLLDDQDYNVWENLTEAYEAMGDEKRASASIDRAIQLAERAVGLNAQNADAHATLAALYARKGLRVSSIQNIHTSLALAPKDKGILSEVAGAYEILGDRRQAIRYLELAIQNGYSLQQVAADPSLQKIASDPSFPIQVASKR